MLKFKNGLHCAIQSLDMKSYDNFDIHIYGKREDTYIWNWKRYFNL